MTMKMAYWKVRCRRELDFEQDSVGLEILGDDDPEVIKTLHIQLDLTKRKLKEAEERLAITKSKINVNIHSEEHEKALVAVKTEGINIVATLADMESDFQLAKQYSNTFESHMEELKAVGVSPKSLLKLTASFTANTAITKLFWIRKLGNFQNAV